MRHASQQNYDIVLGILEAGRLIAVDSSVVTNGFIWRRRTYVRLAADAIPHEEQPHLYQFHPGDFCVLSSELANITTLYMPDGEEPIDLPPYNAQLPWLYEVVARDGIEPADLRVHVRTHMTYGVVNNYRDPLIPVELVIRTETDTI